MIHHLSSQVTECLVYLLLLLSVFSFEARYKITLPVVYTLLPLVAFFFFFFAYQFAVFRYHNGAKLGAYFSLYFVCDDSQTAAHRLTVQFSVQNPGIATAAAHHQGVALPVCLVCPSRGTSTF